MNQLALCLLVSGLLTGAFPDDKATGVDPEIDAIRSVADAYISADPTKIRDSFLPGMNLYTTTENGSLRTIPFAEYLQRTLASAAAPREPKEASIDLIDRTGNVAIVKITTLSSDVTVTDYLSLVHIEKRWKVVNKTFLVEPRKPASSRRDEPSGGAESSPCAGREHRRFDFMLGKWHTSDLGSATIAPAEGESTVESMLDGCIIHEHRSLVREGKHLSDGDAYWGYDSTTKHWLLFYLDDQAHMQVYQGEEKAGQLAFFRERPDSNGNSILIRIVYTPASASTYTQTVDRSVNRGQSWEPGGITTYQSKR